MPKGSIGGKRAVGENSVYKPKNAYESYKEKMYKASGASFDEDGELVGGNKEFSGKIYTNDEFMEHLEDGNWHSLVRAIIDNKLTNKQVEEIKNNMKLGLWSFGDYKNLKSSSFKTGKEYTDAIIKDAKRSSKVASYKEKASKATNTVDKQYYLQKARKAEIGTDKNAEKIKIAKQIAKKSGFSEANYKQFLRPTYREGYSQSKGRAYSLAELKSQLNRLK